MTLRRDARHGARIARAEFRRSCRQALGSPRRVAGLAVSVLFFGGQLLFALPTAYLVGRTARSADPIPYLGPGAVLVFVGVLLLATFRTLERLGGIDAEELVLTVVHPRAAVLGLVGAELGRLAVWLGVPSLAVVVAFAAGLGSISFVVTAGLVVLPLVCWAAVWGYALGIVLLRLLRRLPGFRGVLKGVGVLALASLVVGSQFAGQFVAEEDVSVRGLLSAFAFEPLTDYVALAFLGTPLARPISPGSAALFAALLALIPVGLALASRQASELWLTDPPTRGRTRRTGTSTGGFAPQGPFARTKSARVAWSILVRTVRSPQSLNHLLMAVFFLGPLGSAAFTSSGDALGPFAAGIGVGVGTYVAGAAFGLNPLGDDRRQLPLLLLTETSPRTLVRGRTLAGLTVGAPFAVLAPVASLPLGTPPSYAVAFAAAGVGACVAASAFAVGLGAAYPIYEEREFWGTETVAPSMLVMTAYLFVVVGGTTVGLVALAFALSGGLDPSPLLAGGVGAYLLLTAGVSFGSYRYAIRRYRNYTFD